MIGVIKNIISLLRQAQIINWKKLKIFIPKLLEYYNEWKIYSKMEGAESFTFKNARPKIFDKTLYTNIDKHYFFQDIWAFKKILESNCVYHFDIGSRVDFLGLLSTITQVTFVDIRPIKVKLENFKSKKGSILSLPYNDESINSLSCLHVAEHVGLGRYGDILDPLGTKKAAKELTRVLAPNGNLYFSLPIGKPKLYYNSHRVHSTNQILSYFPELKLLELSGVDDNGKFVINVKRNVLDSCNYGCGFFYFTKT